MDERAFPFIPTNVRVGGPRSRGLTEIRTKSLRARVPTYKG